ncbi:MAG: Elongation factor Ts [Chlamydiia bacterium]|nr:Elongation factor Ts [Chlamydiia bacterium]MCH9624807.1 Elongation factor Ts [Chlamydiia bacterium]
MTAVTAQMIKSLRDRTGVGMIKCKNALVESGGDIEGAIALLRKAGIASAVKKESREAKEGAIDFVENANGIGIVQMNAETDFVVNNEKFREFLHVMAEEVAAGNVSTLEEFIAAPFTKESPKTIDEKRKEMISVLGENILISKMIFLKKESDVSYGIYSHMNGKIFTLVEIAGSSDEAGLAKEIAMHAAAEAPEYLSESEIPKEIKAQEEEIAKSRVPAGKPAEIVEKIVSGKMQAFYNDVCLVNQKYIKDNSTTIENLVNSRGKELGKELKVKGFYRLQIGA